MSSNFFKLFFIVCVTASTKVLSQSVSVNHLTGAAQSYIPFWTLSDRSVSANVGLSYYNSGVPVGVPQGNAGVGWSLTGMGSVTRELHGLPDDYRGAGTDARKGWLIDGTAAAVHSYLPSTDVNTSICSDEALDWNYFTGLNYNTDTEPDVFYVDAPGISFGFVFDVTGTPKMLSFNEYTLSIVKSGDKIDTIKVTDTNGTKYVFVKGTQIRKQALPFENQYVDFFATEFGQYRDSLSYTASWNLWTIRSLDGGLIEYSYGDIDSETSTRRQQIIRKNNENVYEVKTLYSLQEKVSERRLESISSSAFTVVFRWQTDVVRSVEVFDSENPSNNRSFDLGYNSVKSSAEAYAYSSKRRLFLKELLQRKECNSMPPYLFQYHGLAPVEYGYVTDIPFVSEGIETDFWGFHNNKTNSQMPKTYYYSTAFDGERLRIVPTAATANVSYPGGDRSAYYSAAINGSLSKLVLPEGGHIYISYELNRYYDNNAAQYLTGAGLRVAYISRVPEVYGALQIKTFYDYSNEDGSTSGKIAFPPSYGFMNNTELIRSPVNLAPDGGVYYSRVTEYQPGNGRTVFYFSSPALYPSVSAENWSATRAVFARRPLTSPDTCIPVGRLAQGYYTYPYAPNPNYSFARGLQVKVQTFDNDSTLVAENNFKYLTLGGAGTQVSGLKYEISPDYIYFAKYHHLTGVAKLMRSQWNQIASDLSPTDFLYDSVAVEHIAASNVPRKVTTYAPDGYKTVSKTSYIRDFVFGTPFSATETILNDIKAGGGVNWPIEQVVYKNEENPANVLTASLSYYQKNPLNEYSLKETYLSPKTTNFAAATVITQSSKQKLSVDASYIKSGAVEEFDAMGNAVTMFDGKVSYSGTHFGYNYRWPVLSVTNAKASEIIFSNFEGASSFGFTATNTTEQPGATGDKAARLTSSSSVKLQRTSIPKSLRTNRYLFSVRLKASAARVLTLTFKNSGGTVLGTYQINYEATEINNWVFKKVAIDVTSFPSTFRVDVNANGSLDVDDVILYPDHATIALQTHDPLSGPTTVADMQGRYTKIEYDGYGRKSKISDDLGNLLELYEYHYFNTEDPMPANVSITPPGNREVVVDASLTFESISDSGCVPVDAYQWLVDDVPAGTGTTLSYTFDKFKDYTVRLLGMSVGDTTFSSVTVEAHPVVSLAQMQIVNSGSDTITNCDPTIRTFSIPPVNKTGCGNSVQQFAYQWYYQCTGSNGWQVVDDELQQNPAQATFDIATYISARSYTVKCIITSSCYSDDEPDHYYITVGEVTKFVTYTGGVDCP